MEGFGGLAQPTVTGLIVQTTGSFVPGAGGRRTDRRGVGGFLPLRRRPTDHGRGRDVPSGGYSFEGRRDQYRDDALNWQLAQRWFTNACTMLPRATFVGR